MKELLDAFQRVLGALDRLEAPYYVCGSMASANYGFPRQTNDIDIVVDFDNADLAEFCRLLQPEFYVDSEKAQESFERGRSFNAIHRASILKFDFFPCGKSPYARQQLQRRRHLHSAMPGLQNLEFAVCSAEDSVLSKLNWYREGGQSSSQQWGDILAILQVQLDALDYAYLRHWAARLDLTELLEKAVSCVRPSPAQAPAPSSEPAG